MTQTRPKYLKDYQPPVYTVSTIDLDVDLYETHANVTNTMRLHKQGDEALVLNGEHQTLEHIKVNGELLTDADYTLTDETLTLHALPSECVLTIQSSCKPQENKTLSGLYRSGSMFCTQCEAEGFRRITYYLDRPDVLACFSTTIRADKKTYPVLLSNGNCVEEGALDHGRHFCVWEDPFPKPAYLFALVAGDLDCLKDTYTTQTGRHVQLALYTEHGQTDQCHYAIEALKRSMRWDEERFGREYDLDIYMIVAVNDFNMGAMENKGLNIFNTKYVFAHPQTATDQNFIDVEAVIGHEYFHNWTGNRITCRDWFQLSLKEGLTVFRDQEFTADLHTRSVKRIEDVKIIRSAQFAEDASPMAHPIRPASYVEMNNFYTVTVYNKGAEVIRMMHTLLGETRFRKGMDLYFERYDGQAVTCDDFVQAMEDASQVDLTQFRRWYAQAGTPVLTIKDTYDENQKTYTLDVSQTCSPTADNSPKEPFHIPLKLTLLSPTGEEETLTINGQAHGKEMVIDITKPTQRICFEGIQHPPHPSLLRDFSAPVKLEYDFTEEQLTFLYANETNAFNRWDAGQELFKRTLLNAMEEGASFILPESILHALKATLHSDLDPALIAQAIQLPSLAALTQTLDPVPVESLIMAHKTIQHTISHTLNPELIEHYQRYNKQTPYQLDDASMAQRTLKNTLLALINKAPSDDAFTLALEQFRTADNMTDQYGALSVLAHYDRPETEEAMNAFYQQWQHLPLVVDKWLTAQALAQHSQTRQRVRELTTHAAFSLSNPNKVYSLLVAFSQNIPQFHDKQGEGYALIREHVLTIDAFNPQVAARTVRSLMNWKRYEAPYKDRMKQELETIKKHSTLSKDVGEIVNKSLL